jgi:Na+-driven multidrug efflux pump
MNPPEPAVAKYATEYIGIRAWGLLAALLGFVATGTYRGFKVGLKV